MSNGILQRWQGKIKASLAVIGKGGLTMTNGGLLYKTVEDNITAHSGGTQAAAYQLTKQINRVATVAAANDSVALPAAVAGLEIQITNDAAVNSMQVFGSGTDTINDVATATGVAQAAGKSAIYSCPVAGKWYRTLSA